MGPRGGAALVQLLTVLVALVSAGCRQTKPSRPQAPPAYIEMTVAGISSSGTGEALMLVDSDQRTVVPILIGGTEALSIQLRLEHQRFERPLTHDLLDTMVQRLGAELQNVQVDDIRDGAFIGSVYLRKDGHPLMFDARPSDAIALALGSGVPIFVARRVVNRAGVRKDQMNAPGGGLGPIPDSDTQSL